MKNKKFIIISFDAVDGNDLSFLSTLPHFGKLIKKSSYSKSVKTIYPSLTYPAHTSIITGLKPINHKIVNNIKIQPSRCNSPDWFWKKYEIKADTLFDIAKRNDMVCSSILWPVSCKAPIKYNMPEIFSNRNWQNQILVSALNGSIKYQWTLNNKFSALRDGLKQPNLDNFAMSCFLYTLTEYNPDIMFLHLTDVDTNRHHHGYSSSQAEYALRRHDLRLGDLIAKLELLDYLKDTYIVLLGDHSMKNAHSVIKLNTLFKEKSWLTLDKNNKSIKSHEVFCNFCDGSAYIYVKDKTNKTLIEKVKNELERFSLNNNNCIKKIYSSENSKELGFDENCTFMLEATDGYYFINDFTMPIIEKVDGKFDKATHGYHPDTYDNKTFFMIYGNDIKQNFDIGSMNITDIAPTIAKLMNEQMLDIDGKVLKKIFTNN